MQTKNKRWRRPLGVLGLLLVPGCLDNGSLDWILNDPNEPVPVEEQLDDEEIVEELLPDPTDQIVEMPATTVEANAGTDAGAVEDPPSLPDQEQEVPDSANPLQPSVTQANTTTTIAPDPTLAPVVTSLNTSTSHHEALTTLPSVEVEELDAGSVGDEAVDDGVGGPVEVSLDAQANLDLILGNAATRSDVYDDNALNDTPMSGIRLGDFTTNEEIYYTGRDEPLKNGNFRTVCDITHFGYDDPLAYPGQPGRAHLHMFFGNNRANAYSDFDSLLNSGAGSCNGQYLNRSSYWVPALLDRDGNALLPWQVMVYYKNNNWYGDSYRYEASPYPDGLGMISGNAGATSPQPSESKVGFSCGKPYSAATNGASKRTPTIPRDCRYRGESDNESLEMWVQFPSCWNPDAGSYRSDQSHMTFPRSGSNCPSSHPVKVPTITYRIFFRLKDLGGSVDGWFLSSDYNPQTGRRQAPGTTLHADWFGAWNKEAMDLFVQNCNNVPGADCTNGYLIAPNKSNERLALAPREQKFNYWYPGKDNWQNGWYDVSSGLTKVPAAELVKLCPSKQWDGTANGVSYCQGSHSGHSGN